MKVRGEIMSFASQMEAKMKENDDRNGWEYEGYLWLLSRLKQETKELKLAIKCAIRLECRANLSEVIREAADVANFAMMIADNAKTNLKEIRDLAKCST